MAKSSKPLSDPQRLDFLLALGAGCTVTEASKRAGVPRRTLYYWREEDPDFAGLWDHAAGEGHDVFESEVRTRALDRHDPKSHIMLIFLLKKLNPEWKEHWKPEPAKRGSDSKEFDFSSEEIDEARKILEAARTARDATMVSDEK